MPSDHVGWFWQLQKLPDAPESRYLYHLLAGHDFQEGLKNYRDLAFLGRHARALGARACVVFDDMIDTREQAYAERMPQADALLAVGPSRQVRRGARRRLDGRAQRRRNTQDVAALGTAEERDQWARILRLEAALLAAPNDDETNVIREKTAPGQGRAVLAPARVLQGARVERAPHAARISTRRCAKRRTAGCACSRRASSMPDNTGEFAARIEALRQRLEAAQQRLAGVAQQQNGLLERARAQ